MTGPIRFGGTRRKLRATPRPHWYFITTVYCLFGGDQEVYRERRYTRRPKRWENRHKMETIGACYGCQVESFL